MRRGQTGRTTAAEGGARDPAATRDAVSQLESRRAELRTQLATTQEQLASLRRARGEETADDEHDPEGPTLSAEWSRTEGHRADLQAELAATSRALGRVANGTYGVCAGCGRPIPAERLELRPDADRCVPCASIR